MYIQTRIAKFTNTNRNIILLISISRLKNRLVKLKFTCLQIRVWESKSRKWNLKESESKIGVSWKWRNLPFRAYSGQRERKLKIREFWRVENWLNPLILQGFRPKKALTKSAIFRNSSNGNRAKLVQNVKNQFFHQLPWRGIWIVETLTFRIYFA